ncbi:hypothetical protein SAMN05216362_1433 [Piscibacillus halophilus]|uniref:Uncharacterized protein n=1 Tax=Piscibacillus halophilus TaxID=571933 RepID=A0A1H9L0X6_9BACI|nr:hypothetical protein SAMN05216362_1433 [Piscibacillus halophilus]
MSKAQKFLIVSWFILGVLSIIKLFKEVIIDNLSIVNIHPLTSLVFLLASIIQIIYIIRNKNNT